MNNPTKHPCGLDKTYCDRCGEDLEVGQVGLCAHCTKPDEPGEPDTFTEASENLAEILNALFDATASLENVMLHFGTQMTPSDQSSRWAVVNNNQALLKRLGWGET